jgi:hypothetical protein
MPEPLYRILRVYSRDDEGLTYRPWVSAMGYTWDEAQAVINSNHREGLHMYAVPANCFPPGSVDLEPIGSYARKFYDD